MKKLLSQITQQHVQNILFHKTNRSKEKHKQKRQQIRTYTQTNSSTINRAILQTFEISWWKNVINVEFLRKKNARKFFRRVVTQSLI
jgi:hypothetical protein